MNDDNDNGNIGIITEVREQENEKRRMNKIVDKLEQRIATLEKVLQSHAKCIGELREEDVTILFKIVDKLEKRIATLEKVLESHAKCIGEMREDKND